MLLGIFRCSAGSKTASNQFKRNKPDDSLCIFRFLLAVNTVLHSLGPTAPWPRVAPVSRRETSRVGDALRIPVLVSVPSRKTARYWIGSGGPVGWASCRRPSSCGCHCASYLPGGCCGSSLLVDAGRGRGSAAGLGRAQGIWVVRNPRARLFSGRDHCCSCCCCCCRCRDGHCQVRTRSGLGVD